MKPTNRDELADDMVSFRIFIRGGGKLHNCRVKGAKTTDVFSSVKNDVVPINLIGLRGLRVYVCSPRKIFCYSTPRKFLHTLGVKSNVSRITVRRSSHTLSVVVLLHPRTLTYSQHTRYFAWMGLTCTQYSQ